MPGFKVCNFKSRKTRGQIPWFVRKSIAIFFFYSVVNLLFNLLFRPFSHYVSHYLIINKLRIFICHWISFSATFPDLVQIRILTSVSFRRRRCLCLVKYRWIFLEVKRRTSFPFEAYEKQMFSRMRFLFV